MQSTSAAPLMWQGDALCVAKQPGVGSIKVLYTQRRMRLVCWQWGTHHGAGWRVMGLGHKAAQLSPDADACDMLVEGGLGTPHGLTLDQMRPGQLLVVRDPTLHPNAPCYLASVSKWVVSSDANGEGQILDAVVWMHGASGEPRGQPWSRLHSHGEYRLLSGLADVLCAQDVLASAATASRWADDTCGISLASARDPAQDTTPHLLHAPTSQLLLLIKHSKLAWPFKPLFAFALQLFKVQRPHAGMEVLRDVVQRGNVCEWEAAGVAALRELAARALVRPACVSLGRQLVTQLSAGFGTSRLSVAEQTLVATLGELPPAQAIPGAPGDEFVTCCCYCLSRIASALQAHRFIGNWMGHGVAANWDMLTILSTKVP